MQRTLVAMVAIVGALVSSSAIAQTASLGNWDATDEECLVSLYFHSDGTARVQNALADGEAGDTTAHWTFDGKALHLTFDVVSGNIDGVKSDSRHITATMHWTESSIGTVHDDPCHFEKE